MTRRSARRALILSFLITPFSAQSQTPKAVLPVGTPLPVRIENHLPMRVGQPIRPQLIYPVYSDNTLILPEKTIFTGAVIELRSNHSQRINARINGDFTPYNIPVIRFTQIILTDGTSLPINTTTATDGAPILRLVAPAPRNGGFVRKQWDYGVQVLHTEIAVFTAPEKGDRLLQFFYHQLPYHPQRIENGTGIVYARGAFHGLTCGALSLMGSDFWREGFGPMLPQTFEVPFNDTEALEQVLAKEKIGAVILEPIQGEAGIVLLEPGYLATVEALCRTYGALFVLDEVQTGVGRTGRFLASHRYGVTPDMIVMAKALSGGLVPCAAVLMTDDIYESVYGSLRRVDRSHLDLQRKWTRHAGRPRDARRA